MHILSDVEHQRRNHPVAPLRRHPGMPGLVVGRNCCCADDESAPGNQQPSSSLAALCIPAQSLGCRTRSLTRAACQCPLCANSTRKSVLPSARAPWLPQACPVRECCRSLRLYACSACPRPGKEPRRKGAQGRHHVQIMAAEVKSIAGCVVPRRQVHQNERHPAADSFKPQCRRSTFFDEGVARIGTPQTHPPVGLPPPSTLRTTTDLHPGRPHHIAPRTATRTHTHEVLAHASPLNNANPSSQSISTSTPPFHEHTI